MIGILDTVWIPWRGAEVPVGKQSTGRTRAIVKRVPSLVFFQHTSTRHTTLDAFRGRNSRITQLPQAYQPLHWRGGAHAHSIHPRRCGRFTVTRASPLFTLHGRTANAPRGGVTDYQDVPEERGSHTQPQKPPTLNTSPIIFLKCFKLLPFPPIISP